MAKTIKLTKIFAEATQAGGGIHTSAELAYMLGEVQSPAFTKFLADCTKKDVLRRLVPGVFESVVTPPDPIRAPYQLIGKIRQGVLNYISLESQLSHLGCISQVIMDRVTVMTKGRSGHFSTPYGVLEFTHTKVSVDEIASSLYLDSEIGMYRARQERALADLKACKRNLHMLAITSKCDDHGVNNVN